MEPIREPKYLFLKEDEQKILVLHSFRSYIFNIRISSRLHQAKL